MYEGRTRGKRMRYTYDEGDDEDEDDNENFSDATSNRRSARQSGRNTPADVGPQYTASGRQVKPRQGGEYGASALSRQAVSPDELGLEYSEDKEASDSEQPVRGGARAARASRGAVNGGGTLKKRKRISDDDDDEGSLDDMSDAAPSGEEWDSQANDDADDAMPDADDESDELDEEDEDGEPKSLMVTLKTGGKPKDDASSPAPVAKPADAEQSTAAGAVKPEPVSSAMTDGAQPTPTTLHTDSNQTEYPTPTSTVHAANGIDKPSFPSALTPQQSGVTKPADLGHANGITASDS